MAGRQEGIHIKCLTINCNTNLEGKKRAKIQNPDLCVNAKLREEVHAVIEEASPDIIFGQELTNKYKTKYEKLSKHCPEGYEAVNTEKEAAVLWKDQAFNLEKEFMEKEKKDAQKQVKSDVESTNEMDSRAAAELYSRSCAVLLKIKHSNSRVLAISWHGPHKASDKMKQHTLACLQKFAKELLNQVRDKHESIPIIIGGDFNYDLREVRKFENGFRFVPYKPSLRRKDLNLIDGFIIYGDPNAEKTEVVLMRDSLLDHDPVATNYVLRTQTFHEE